MNEEHWALIRLYFSCDRGMAGMVYPDGRAVLDQPKLLLDAFRIIATALNRAGKRDTD